MTSRPAFAAAAAALCVCCAQTATPPARTIEDLNLVGAAVSQVQFSDTLLGVDSSFRQAMWSQGMALRAVILPRVTFNLLDGPVAPVHQVYIGQRPTLISGVNPILTADLRQLHLQDAQLNIAAGWRYTNWNPAGPRTLSLTSLYFYKGFRQRRAEIKAGYMGNDTEFVGLQVGGSLATGAQGVYAVLPYQVGMSYFPFASPSFNLRIRGPKYFYIKTAAQRSLDPAGGIVNQRRNESGLRFAPKGDGTLLINEGGFQRGSSATAPLLWVRGGLLYNRTPYTNKATGRKEDGNYCAYLLADYQLTMPDAGKPGHGWFFGATAMTAPSRFNSYDRYYEARAYEKAPFVRRPDDVLSIVAAYRNHSKFVTDSLAAQGKTYWTSSPSVTGSYSIHVSRGNYMTFAAGYVRGAAITPRVNDSLAVTVTWGLYL